VCVSQCVVRLFLCSVEVRTAASAVAVYIYLFIYSSFFHSAMYSMHKYCVVIRVPFYEAPFFFFWEGQSRTLFWNNTSCFSSFLCWKTLCM
jgi:hypothetical protein